VGAAPLCAICAWVQVVWSLCNNERSQGSDRRADGARAVWLMRGLPRVPAAQGDARGVPPSAMQRTLADAVVRLPDACGPITGGRLHLLPVHSVTP
jgi:hypothetical protein